LNKKQREARGQTIPSGRKDQRLIAAELVPVDRGKILAWKRGRRVKRKGRGVRWDGKLRHFPLGDREKKKKGREKKEKTPSCRVEELAQSESKSGKKGKLQRGSAQTYSPSTEGILERLKGRGGCELTGFVYLKGGAREKTVNSGRDNVGHDIRLRTSV